MPGHTTVGGSKEVQLVLHVRRRFLAGAVIGGKLFTSVSIVTMGSPRVIADPATLIAIAWLIIAAFSSLVDAFYASKIIPKHLYITKGASG